MLPELSDYIVSPGLGDNAGITGSTSACHQAFKKVKSVLSGGNKDAAFIFKACF